MKCIYYVFCVIALFCASESFAQTSQCGQGLSVVIVFGNGILETERDADNAKYRIRNLLRATLTQEEFGRVGFAVAYNHSRGLLQDLYESLKQRIGTDNAVASFWRWLGGIELLPDAVQEEFLRVATSFDFSKSVGADDLSDHLALYRAKTLEGKKVIVVSHSQGNFFVNAAHATLYGGSDPLSTKSFGIVSVANPASFVAGGGPHTTLLEDGVIAAIRAITPFGVPPPLAPNLTNILSGAATSDWRGHSFLGEYSATGSRSIVKIVQDIIATMNSLEQPPQIVQSGIISVTLTWGDKSDMDLVVFEPNGTRVFYGRLQGISGRLDRNDTDGFGPEHYCVPYSTLETGTYRIRIDFYSERTPDIAPVRIQTGERTQIFDASQRSASADREITDPNYIADIEVAGDRVNGFWFNVVD